MNDKLPAGGLPPAHLDQVFTPPRRSAGLTGILSAVPPSSAPAAPETDAPPNQTEPAATPEPASGPAAPDPAVSPEPNKPRVSDASAGGKRLVIVYMPASLREWLRKAAVGSTQLQVVLDAVEQAEVDGELGQAVAEAQQPDTGGLFVRPRSSRGSRAHVQVSLSMLASHVDVLDRLVAKHGATDRSALVRAALSHARKHSRRHA